MSNGYIGEIRMFAGNFAPNGWRFCDGSLLSISENEALFQLIGTTYGGDGVSTFALPDLRGRLPQGRGPQSTTGQMGGVEQVTLTVSQIPAHPHALLGDPQSAESAEPAGRVLAESDVDLYASGTGANQSLHPSSIVGTGGSQPHENMQPWLGVNFIISLYGIYPSFF